MKVQTLRSSPLIELSFSVALQIASKTSTYSLTNLKYFICITIFQKENSSIIWIIHGLLWSRDILIDTACISCWPYDSIRFNENQIKCFVNIIKNIAFYTLRVILLNVNG